MNIIKVLFIAALVFVTAQANAASLTKTDSNPGNGIITFTLSDPYGDRFWDGTTGAAIDVISAYFIITPFAGTLSGGTPYGSVTVSLQASDDELFSRSVWLWMNLVNETAWTRFPEGTATPLSEVWSDVAEVNLPNGQNGQPIPTTFISHTFTSTQLTNWLETDTIAYYVEPGTYGAHSNGLLIPDSTIKSYMSVVNNGKLSHKDVIGVQDPAYPSAEVPEPTTMLLLGLGLMGLAGVRGKFQK